MTKEQFHYLFNHNLITVKLYCYVDPDNAPNYCEAFEYDGKYYLRFDLHYIKRTGDKTYRMGNAYIKSFDNKDHANNYFKKVFKNMIKL